MATRARYGKPNMAALPPELGMRIMKTIRETPPPDFEKMDREVEELEKQMKIEREKHRNGK